MWNIIGHQQLLVFFANTQRNGHLSHAYLLTGPSQVGKRTLALAFAQAILCADEQNATPLGSPCGLCHACVKAQNTTHPDLTIIRPPEGKKTLTINSIRELLRAASLQPQEGNYSIFLLPNAELLTMEAANALLKTLEEPPSHTLLLLTATDEHLLPQTIVSRCQVLPVGLVNTQEISVSLEKQWGVNQERAQLLSALASGRPGWAIAASQNQGIEEERASWFQLMNVLCETSPTQRIKIATKLLQDTVQVDELLAVWLLWWREVLLGVEGCHLPASYNGSKLLRYTGIIGPLATRQVIDQLYLALRQLEQNANPRLVLETLLLELPYLKAQGDPLGAR